MFYAILILTFDLFIRPLPFYKVPLVEGNS